MIARLKAALAACRAYGEAHRSIRHLRRLDDSALRDLGLARAAMERAVLALGPKL